MRRWSLLLLQVGATLAAAGWVPFRAEAFEFADGRLQLHGYYESQIRGIARDFEKDEWDLTQFAHVLNLEAEAELAPGGFGPFDLVSAFARVQVRYDCVWTRSCGLFPSADVYGDRPGRLPGRLNDGRRTGFVGNTFVADTRPYRDDPLEVFSLAFRDRPAGPRDPYGIDRTNAFNIPFQSPGPDQILGSADDPSPFVFSRYFGRGSCRFSSHRIQGSEGGVGIFNLGPVDPACEIESLAAFADKPNPFRAEDIHPLYGVGGRGALPYRPAPELAPSRDLPNHVARGLWLPNAELRRRLRDGELEPFDQNFSRDELAWNRGESQQDEKELRELYLDLELLDGRLWLRLGKQTIVWGKTELFRNQDQFNPQDFALASLPSLEDSRIALWAARAVWSFYQVGPLDDVRLELAANFDDIEGNDFGDCAEPYTVYLVCVGTFGFLAHGFEELGLAGVEQPPDPWDDWQGLEAGARLEWRWKRFSFSLSDFYGYADIPTVEKIFSYERNVDPESGRPRRLNRRGPCRSGEVVFDADGNAAGTAPVGDDCLGPDDDALLNHAVNQTLFHKNCAATFGFLPLDPNACGQSIFNSHVDVFGAAVDPQKDATIAALVGNALVANRIAKASLEAPQGPLAGLVDIPLVPLEKDPCDDFFDDCVTPGGAPNFFFTPINTPPASQLSLNLVLSDQQEALLGCGNYYGTNCEVGGIDLMNAEASVLTQSWVGIEGTPSRADWDASDASVAQPGTVGWPAIPVCTRFERGRAFVLPGCRGPGEPGYDVLVDGSTDGLLHPLTGQAFRSEMAALSWNLMAVVIALAPVADPDQPSFAEFDRSDPLRKDGCSFAKPQFCDTFGEFFYPIRVKRNTVNAGGNGRFGRRDFQWHDGTPLYLRYDQRNVLGFSMDFADDVTKSNWSAEATWIADEPYADQDEFDGLSPVDTWNLTLSADRPTFVNFLNPNRTLFFNAQLFLQWIDGWRGSFPANGPWNALATFTVQTGYFQDRFLPQVTLVWDVQSASGAALPQVQYRFTENFSATFGAALFGGRFQERDMAVNAPANYNRTGRHGYDEFVENGLSPIRDRDELFLLLRYTF